MIATYFVTGMLYEPYFLGAFRFGHNVCLFSWKGSVMGYSIFSFKNSVENNKRCLVTRIECMYYDIFLRACYYRRASELVSVNRRIPYLQMRPHIETKQSGELACLKVWFARIETSVLGCLVQRKHGLASGTLRKCRPTANVMRRLRNFEKRLRMITVFASRSA